MRRILTLSLVAAAACSPARSEVEVDWTFAGLSCLDAGVARIQVDIANEVLTPNRFTCAEASLGANLGSYLAGNYELTVSGFDANGTLTHQVIQALAVRGGGKNSYAVDVPRVAATTGDVTLHWTFSGRSCAQAGIATIHASIDGQVLTDANNNPDLPCSQGGTDGTTISPLTPGRHTLDLVGVDGSLRSTYALNGFTVTVVAGQTAVYKADLAPAAPIGASANLSWAFNGKSCAAAGVDHVTIFVDPDANGVGGTSAGTVPCNMSGTDGGSVEGLTPGTHSFAIQGIQTRADGPHLLFRTHQPPASFFQVGLITDVFVSAESLP